MAKFWTSQKIRVLVEGPDGNECVTLDRPYARVGSHQDSEVVLVGEDIPLQTLYLHATDHGIYYVWLSPRAGKPAFGWLDDTRLEVGPYHISAHLTKKTQPASPTDRAELAQKSSSRSHCPAIRLHLDDENKSNCVLKRRLTILGRRPPSTLRVHSSLISTVHCVVYWDSHTVWIVDLLSRNGTRRGKRRVVAEQMPRRATYSLGKIRLSLVGNKDSENSGARRMKASRDSATEQSASDIRSAHDSAIADWDIPTVEGSVFDSESSAQLVVDNKVQTSPPPAPVEESSSASSSDNQLPDSRQLDQQPSDNQPANDRGTDTVWENRYASLNEKLEAERERFLQEEAQWEKERFDLEHEVEASQDRESELRSQLDQQQAVAEAEKKTLAEVHQNQLEETRKQAAEQVTSQQELILRIEELGKSNESLRDENRQLAEQFSAAATKSESAADPSELDETRQQLTAAVQLAKGKTDELEKLNEQFVAAKEQQSQLKTELTKELEASQAKIQELEQLAAARADELATTCQQRDQQATQLEQLHSQLGVATQKLTALESDKALWADSSSTQEAKLLELTEQRDQFAARLAAESEKLTARNRELTDKIGQLEETLQLQIAAHTEVVAKLGEAEQLNGRLSEERDQALASGRQAEHDTQTQAEKNREIAANLDSLKRASQTKQVELEQQLADSQDRNSQLESELTSQVAANERAAQKLKRLTAERDKLQQQLAEQLELSEELESSLDSRQHTAAAQLTKLQQQIAEQRQVAENWSERCQQLESSVEKSKTQQQETAADNNRLQTQLAELQQQLATQQDQHTSTDQRLAGLAQQLEQVQRQRDEAATNLKSAKTEIANCRTQINQLEQDRHESDLAQEEAREEIEYLRTTIANKTKEVSRLRRSQRAESRTDRPATRRPKNVYQPAKSKKASAENKPPAGEAGETTTHESKEAASDGTSNEMVDQVSGLLVRREGQAFTGRLKSRLFVAALGLLVIPVSLAVAYACGLDWLTPLQEIFQPPPPQAG